MPSVSWGTRFIDYDNDGRRDVFEATGHVYPHLIQNPVCGEKYFQEGGETLDDSYDPIPLWSAWAEGVRVARAPRLRLIRMERCVSVTF